jgi:hypothetical protein
LRYPVRGGDIDAPLSEDEGTLLEVTEIEAKRRLKRKGGRDGLRDIDGSGPAVPGFGRHDEVTKIGEDVGHAA